MPGRKRAAALLEVSSMITLLRTFPARGELQYTRHQISPCQGLKAQRASFYQLCVMKGQAGNVECPRRRKNGVPLTGSTGVVPEAHGGTLCRQSLRDRMICWDQSCCADACENPPPCRLFINVKGAGPNVFLIQEKVGRELSRETARMRVRADGDIRVAAIRRRWRESLRRL